MFWEYLNKIVKENKGKGRVFTVYNDRGNGEVPFHYVHSLRHNPLPTKLLGERVDQGILYARNLDGELLKFPGHELMRIERFSASVSK